MASKKEKEVFKEIDKLIEDNNLTSFTLLNGDTDYAMNIGSSPVDVAYFLAEEPKLAEFLSTALLLYQKYLEEEENN